MSSAAQTVLRGGSYLSAYVSGYTYFNLQHGWVLSSNGVFRMSEVRNYEQMQTFLNEQPDVSSTLYWLNNTRPGGARPGQPAGRPFRLFAGGAHQQLFG